MLFDIFKHVRDKVSILGFGSGIFAHKLLEIAFHIDGMVLGRVFIGVNWFCFSRLVATLAIFVLTIVFWSFGVVVGEVMMMRLNFTTPVSRVMGFVLRYLNMSFRLFP